MEKEKIERINQLAHKSKTVGLTIEESVEQDKLRKEYIAAWKQSLVSQLENTYIVTPDGKKTKVKRKSEKEKEEKK